MKRDKPQLLIISFSDISADARVLKQALLFANEFDVVTCGYGSSVREDIEHIGLEHIPESMLGLRRYIEPLFVRTHLYRLAFQRDPRVRRALRALENRSFDVVIANELETLPVAFLCADERRVLLDLHEYYPGLRDDLPAWVNVRQPYQEWLLRKKVRRVGAVTTVSQTIADRYSVEFGFTSSVVRNAANYRSNLQPGDVNDPIRIVHSGVAAENRRPEVMMEAVAASRSNVTLDLFLTAQQTEFGQRLHDTARALGDRIKIHAPVPNAELVEKLNNYDIGMHVLAPTNTNNALALPNKFFDFVQARLGMIIGPTPDMASLLTKYGLGAVAGGFEVKDVITVLDGLDRNKVANWKKNSDTHAEELSAEQQQGGWISAVERILANAS